MAGTPFEDGLVSELETVRDALLRRLDRQPGVERTASGSAELPRAKRLARSVSGRGSSCSLEGDSAPGVQVTVPVSLLVEEVQRAQSMSAHPHFWLVAAQCFTIGSSSRATVGMKPSKEMLTQELTLEEVTEVLLEWLRFVPVWEQDSEIAPTDSQASEEGESLPVRLHIYDVSQGEGVQKLNKILAHKYSPFKLGGVFHAAVEVNGLEWSFGFVPSETKTGVYSSKPKEDAQHHYRQTVVLGYARIAEEDVNSIICDLVEEYSGRNYDLLRRNCCHFADDFAERLGGLRIPGWVHRLARLGAAVDNVLQAAPSPIKDRLYSY